MPKMASIDANYWALPQVWEAGFWGGVVYQQLLILNQSHDCRGSLPFAITRPDYLARVMLLEGAEGLSVPAVELVRAGIRAAQRAGLLRVTGDGILLLVWSGSKASSAQPSRVRQANYRKRLRELGGSRSQPVKKSRRKRVTERDVTLRNAPSPPLALSQIPEEIPDQRSQITPEVSVTARYVTPVTPTETIADIATHPVAQQAIDAWADRQLAALTGQEPRGATEEVAPLSATGPEVDEAPGARQKKAKREKTPPPMEALTLGILLAECIVENHPDSKLARMSEADRAVRATAWADSVRLLHERDGFSYGEIQSMILWSQKHSFWSTVILSGTNLRSHWEKMTAQRGGRRQQQKQEPGVGRSEPAPHNTYRDGEVPV